MSAGRRPLQSLSRLSWLRVRVTVAVLVGVVGAVASRYGRTGVLLDSLNGGASHTETKRSSVDRITSLAREQLSDAYVRPEIVGKWMETISRSPAPLLEYYDCILAEDGTLDTDCALALEAREFAPVATQRGAKPSWGLPGAKGVPRLGSEDLAMELDAERLVANLESLAPSLLELRRGLRAYTPPREVLDPSREFDDGMLRLGLSSGLENARDYIEHRKVRRDPAHPVTALVMSGGAGNGAFTAGFVSRLFDLWTRCRVEDDPCKDARIDIAVGTSAGALVGTLVDMFFTRGQEKRAAELLAEEFTCGVSSDLYCRNDAWLPSIFTGQVRGLVTFDGLSYLLRSNLSQPLAGQGGISTSAGMDANALEVVTMSFDTQTAVLFASSDQDPAGVAGVDGRVRSVMASVVEPGLAAFEPALLRGRASTVHGTFIDGGIVTPVPALEAVRRGAERAVVVSNWTREPSPDSTLHNGGDVFFRSLEVQTLALASSEMSQVDLAAAARRLREYQVCRRRFASVSSDEHAVEEFCQRRFRDAGATSGVEKKRWFKEGAFPWVASSWQSTWVHRSEDATRPAVGYSFDPAVMQPLFLDGIAEYQRNCRQIHELLGVEGRISQEECPPPPPDAAQDPFVRRASERLRSVAACSARATQRLCP